MFLTIIEMMHRDRKNMIHVMTFKIHRGVLYINQHEHPSRPVSLLVQVSLCGLSNWIFFPELNCQISLVRGWKLAFSGILVPSQRVQTHFAKPDLV